MAMDEDKYQKELFEFEKPKRFFPRISDLFPKSDFERNVALTLTLDKAVFIAIGIVMLMVVVYALGIEAGKKRPAEPLQAQTASAQIPVGVQTKTVLIAARPVSGQQKAAVSPRQNAITEVPAARSAAIHQNAGGAFTILAATFGNKDNALQEIRKLRLQGLDAFLVQKDSRFFACVGTYQDKASVQIQNDLKKVKRLRSDAYVRLK